MDGKWVGSDKSDGGTDYYEDIPDGHGWLFWALVALVVVLAVVAAVTS